MIYSLKNDIKKKKKRPLLFITTVGSEYYYGAVRISSLLMQLLYGAKDIG